MKANSNPTERVNADARASEKPTRDAERSRRALLDAAEAVFAEKGYQAATMREIGERAGLSRGAPGYFFGSKAQLYRAVLERSFGRVGEILVNSRDRVHDAGGDPAAVFAAGMDAYLDFLIANPNFVRLLGWEALSGGAMLREVPEHQASIQLAVELIAAELRRGEFRDVDPAYLLLSIMSLGWFPLTHASTLLPVLGIDVRDPAFQTSYRAHVFRLVLDGVRAQGTPDRAEP